MLLWMHRAFNPVVKLASSPPLFPSNTGNGCFFPILEQMDRLSPDRVVPLEKMLPEWEALGCFRGLVLHKDSEKFMVLDPITGNQHPVRFPSSIDKTAFGFFLAMVVPSAADHDYRMSYRLVALFTDKATGKRVVTYVYSSESGCWGGDPVSTLTLPSRAIHLGRPGTIVGNVIHWFLYGYKVLTFDLEMQILDFNKLLPEVKKNLQVPTMNSGDRSYHYQQVIVMVMLRLAVVAEPDMQFWEMKKAGEMGVVLTHGC
uniref:DUF1618 domain-containing protein n=1 Tax=Leersia perrieri TaxID=77586 RepID=A0A0D9XY58_9ORYZ